MNCQDFIKRLSDYVDSECSAEIGSAMRGHMHGCKECSLALQESIAWLKIADDAPELEPPEFLFAKIKGALKEQEIDDSKKSLWWFRWIRLKRVLPLVFGGGFALACLSFLFYENYFSESQALVPDTVMHLSKPSETVPGILSPESWEDKWRRDVVETEQDYLAAISLLEKEMAALENGTKDRTLESPEQWQLILRETKANQQFALSQTLGNDLDRERVIGLYQERIASIQDHLLGEF